MTVSEKMRKNSKDYFEYKKEDLTLFLENQPNEEITNVDKTKKIVKIAVKLKPINDPIQKQRNEKKWKESIGYYYLNPGKFRIGLKDL
jgi:hypothetical protein